VVAEGGLFTAEVVAGTVHRLRVETFYTRFGDVFAWAVVAAAAVLLWRKGVSITARSPVDGLRVSGTSSRETNRDHLTSRTATHCRPTRATGIS